jgi:cation diffusion facilitator CzcD-associated flavoprotein CzcO
MWAHEPWALNPLLRPAVRTVVERFAAAHLRYRVSDSWQRRLLTPTYAFGRRQALVSSEYYPALCRPNTTLLHWPIASVSKAGVRTSDALEHQVDTLVLATGSEVLGVGARFPVVGRDGKSLARERTERGGAYKGVNVAGFPNLFLVPGPGQGPGGHAALLYLDARIDYTVRALDRLAEGDIRSLDIRADVQRTHERVLRGRLSRDLWDIGNIRGGGHVTEFRFDPEVYPGPAVEYAATLSAMRLADYTVESGSRGPLQPVSTSNGGRG